MWNNIAVDLWDMNYQIILGVRQTYLFPLWLDVNINVATFAEEDGDSLMTQNCVILQLEKGILLVLGAIFLLLIKNHRIG